MSSDEDSTINSDISKSFRKRKMHDLQSFSRSLVNLPLADLNKVIMDQSLLHSIKLAKRIKNKHEAFNREIQFIAKTISVTDYAALQDAVAELNQTDALSAHKLKQLNAVFESLFDLTNQELHVFFNSHPNLDKHFIRSSLHKLKKEASDVKCKSEKSKKLFNYLRSNLQLIS